MDNFNNKNDNQVFTSENNQNISSKENSDFFTNDSINFVENDYNNIQNKKKRSLKFRKKLIFKIAAYIFATVLIGNIIGFAVGYSIPKFKNRLESDEVSYNNDSENSASNPIINISKSVVSVTASSNSDDQTNIFGNNAESQNMGSGIVFYQTSEKVYIVTNYHVISGANAVDISFGDDKYVPASLVGKHQISDIAVISVNKLDLKNIGVNSVKTAYFGDSDKLSVGDSVIAIGNAFGNGNIATRGIISVVQKDIPVTNTDSLSVIQTDAAINVGNDGGALINQNGEVIGINTAKYAYYTVEGIGYSISSNVAKPVIEEIMNKKEFPYLGVTVTSITEETAKENDLPQMGVFVQGVVKGSPADKAGIRPYDIITAFNSNPVFTPTQLTEAVRKCNVGDDVEIKIVREGKMKITLNATLLQDLQNSF